MNIQADLTRQQNEFKIKLKELEDSLLSRLSSAGGNFLGDTALVENLEITKRTAQEIEQKVFVLSSISPPPPSPCIMLKINESELMVEWTSPCM